MEILYTFNVLAAALLLLAPLWFSRRYLRLPLVNPLTIAMAVGIPVQMFKLIGGPLVLIDNGLSDSGYQFAVLMSNLQVVCQLAGTILFYRLCGQWQIQRVLPLRRTSLSARDARRAELAFLALFAASYVLLAYGSDYGVVAWLTNPREGYQLHRTGAGQWYALATSFLGVAYLLSFLRNPRPRPIIFNLLLYLFLSYFLGSKGTMLSLFTSGVVFLWFIRWPYLGRLLTVGLPLVFALLLLNLFLAMADGFGIDAILEYFDYFKNAADYYDAYFTGQLPLFHGQVMFSELWSYVPRGIWPDKPYTYGILLINDFFYPGQAELTNTPAFGGAVEQFADFGIPGVVLFGVFSAQSIATALLSYLTFRRPGIDMKRMTVAAAGIMVVQFAPMFGAYFPGALYMMLLAFVVLVLLMARRRKRSMAGGSGHPANGQPLLPAS